MRGTVHLRGDASPIVVEIHVEGDALRASSEASEWFIPHAEVVITSGGFDNDHVFCRTPDGSLTIASNDPALLGALQRIVHPHVQAQLQSVDRQRHGHSRARRLGILIAASAVAALLILLGATLFVAPRMLAAGVDAVPIEVDEQLGDAAASAMSGEGANVDDPRIVGAVETIVETLAPHTANPQFSFRIHIIENDAVNAFALPGGQIFVYTGLLKEADRPEEVAGVLAHEMAHVTLRHGIRNVAHRAGLLLAVSLLLGDQSGWLELATDVAIMAEGNQYSQEQEAAADGEGTRTLLAAEVDPQGLIEFFQRLSEEPGTELTGPMSWLSTHPDHASRITHVQAQIEHAGATSARPLPVDWASVRAALGR